MEKKLLLIITKNDEFSQNIQTASQYAFTTTCVNNIHAGYSLALNLLPDIILFDFASLGLESLKSISQFKATHFLNKSFLFLFSDQENRKVLETNFKDLVDGIIYERGTYTEIISDINDIVRIKHCASNYWKDSFLGLFNLLEYPVILLQDEKITAMNDAFKKDFFITGKQQVELTDLVLHKHKSKVKETLKRFVKGKHMKAATKTALLMNGKLREAKITFSKLDKSLCGQLIMMINFTGNEFPINDDIGTYSCEVEKNLYSNPRVEEQSFTKREKEVIVLLCKGYKTREISETLCISEKTIEKHRASIIKRTDSGTILESIVYALNHNLIEI